MRVFEGDTLTFTVDDIPQSLEYDIFIRYEPQVRYFWWSILQRKRECETQFEYLCQIIYMTVEMIIMYCIRVQFTFKCDKIVYFHITITHYQCHIQLLISNGIDAQCAYPIRYFAKSNNEYRSVIVTFIVDAWEMGWRSCDSHSTRTCWPTRPVRQCHTTRRPESNQLTTRLV